MSSPFITLNEPYESDQLSETPAAQSQAAVSDEILAQLSGMKTGLVVDGQDCTEMMSLAEMLASALVSQSVLQELDDFLADPATATF